MTHLWTQLLAWTAVLVVFLRVEHLVASAVWTFRRGAQYADALHRLTPRQRQNPERISAIFASSGGGKLPFLFMGVKSYRLERLSNRMQERGRVMSAVMATMLRGVWRYYTFPLLFCPVIIWASLVGAGAAFRFQMLTISLLLLLGFVSIAAESLFAVTTMGSWMTHYHRFPDPPERDNHPDTKWEGTARLGVLICLVLPCIFTAISVSAAFFDGYQSFPDSAGDRALFVLDSCVNLIGFATEPSRTAAGAITKLVTVATAAVYLLFVVATLAGMTRPASRPSDRA